MEIKNDYTKFKLKSEQEIINLITDIDSLYIISCNKCYKEFTDNKNENCSELANILAKNNKKIVGCTDLDFLCNAHLTNRKIKHLNLSEVGTVGVVSCGLGIQFISEKLENKNVIAFADSIQQGDNATSLYSYHGISLNDKKCAACSQCYLNLTGGICPIVDCSKSLLNGSCGGAKNGKCEVKLKDGKSKDCAWEKIYTSLNLKNKSDFEVQIRNYSKPELAITNSLSETNRINRKENFYGGIYPDENKNLTKDSAVLRFPEPEVAVIALSQHTGTPCEPLVSVGYKVKIGQKIGDSQSFITAPVHSSISGEVIAIEERPHPIINQNVVSVVIKNDFKNETDNSNWNKTAEDLSAEKKLDIIKDNGIVGMGGAAFPTHVKFKPPKPIDTLILNGCECEPYLTGDYRIMLENTKEILHGTRILLNILNIQKAIIAIEDNKKDAYEKLVAENSDNKIEFVLIKTKYPQGAERMLIKKLLNREVPIGGLPLDVGVVVSNVSTVFAVYNAIINGTPLIERIITVSGKNCKKPGNYRVKIGTPIKNIIEHCFGTSESINKGYVIKMGGQMMGINLQNIEAPVIKGTTGIIVFEKNEIEFDKDRKCIKCGRCAEVCPMELYPMQYVLNFQLNTPQEAKKHDVKSCIECGCCEYICSSKIPIVSIVKQEKELC